MTQNIMQFPKPKEEVEILRFSPGYIDNIYFGGGWKVLVDVLPTHWDKIPHMMRPFVLQMAKSKTRPNNDQLSILVGLIVGALSRSFFDECTESEASKADNVTPLKRNS